MNGYFDGLIRMTGINFNQSRGIESPRSEGISTVQPIHVEKTTVVEPRVHAPASAPVEPEPHNYPHKIPPPNEYAQNTNPGTILPPKTTQAKKAVEREPVHTHSEGIKKIDGMEIQPDRKQHQISVPVKNGHKDIRIEKTQKIEVQPGEKIDKSEKPGTGQKVKHQDGLKTRLGQYQPGEPVEHKELTPQPGNQNQGIEEHVLVVDINGKVRDTPKTAADTAVKHDGFSPGQREENEKNTGTGDQPVKPGAKPGIEEKQGIPAFTLKEVRQWVAETPKPSPPDSNQAPLEENREFHLSIGSINLTVEEPQAQFPMEPPFQQNNPRTTRGEPPANRLTRHYIR